MADKKSFNAQAMMVVYSDGEDYYLEAHEIFNGAVQQGKPMSLKGLRKLGEVFKKSMKTKLPAIRGVIPKGLLYIDTDNTKPMIIWYRAPEKRKLYFKVPKKEFSGVSDLPGLIFVLNDEDLAVSCILEEPKDDSPLYFAPFPNVHGDSGICMGNVKLKYDTDDISEIIRIIENHFFNSRFTHTGAECLVEPIPMWEKLIKEKKPFDPSVLIPTNKTLKKYIHEHSKK